MSLTEEKIKVQVERLRTYAAHNPSAIITEVADALAAVREEQAVEIARLREANAELLEGLCMILDTDMVMREEDEGCGLEELNHARELIAKHGGK